MTAYHALALPLSQRSEIVKSAYFGGAWDALKGGLAKTRDNVWNAGAAGMGQMKQDATNGLKSMAANAQTAIDGGIDKGLDFVNKNISQPMQQAGQAVVGGAQALGQGAQQFGQDAAAVGGDLMNQGARQAQQVGQSVQQGAQAVGQGAQNLGNQAVQGAQNLGNQAVQGVQNAGRSLAAGASNMATNAIDNSLSFVDKNISAPMYGAMGAGINTLNAGLAAHGGPGFSQPAAPTPPAAMPQPQLAGSPTM